MPGGTRRLGSGVEADRCPHILVPEQLTDEFILAGVVVEPEFGGSVPKAMGRHIEPGVLVHSLLDLAAESTGALVFTGSLARKQIGTVAGQQQRSPLGEIDVEKLDCLI